MMRFIELIGTMLLGCIINEIQNRYRGEILYLCRNEELVVPKGVGIQDIQILYKQQPIDRLSVAKLLIVNNSQHVLEKRDLDNEGLCIKTAGEANILRIDWQNSTDTDNVYALPVSADKKSVAIKFHHLNPGNAWLFQVFHTGKSSNSLTCICSAAGITNTKKVSIEGRSVWELAFLIPLQALFLLLLIAISLTCCEKGGWMMCPAILLWAIIVALIIGFVSLWEFNYRFKGWYKMAQKNGF